MTPLSGGDVYSIWARYVRPEHAGWTWRMLHGLYDGLGRHYHRLDHVCACLAELEALVNPGACDVEVAALALIWHDAVYVPGDPDNEQLSGQLLMAVSRTRLGSVNIGVFERAYNAILVTQHHDGEAMGDHTIAAVVDIDLSILGAPSHVYWNYAAKVRQEFAHVSDEAWRHGRGAFLAGMLARSKPIFTLASMYEKYEARARENMNDEHDQLVSR